MTENKIIPNSFQTPNFYVDECMAYLTGNEIKCVLYIARKIFGWQKRSDCIAKSQIIEATGLSAETVDKVMATLVEFGIVLRLAENNASKNNGVEWALQTDSDAIRFDLMRQRMADQTQRNRTRTSKARQQRAKQGGGDIQQPHLEKASVEQKAAGGGSVQHTGGGDVGQTGGGDVQYPPQKPIKATRKHGDPASVDLGANAPARAAAVERIGQFPEDVRAGVELMRSVFNLLPPEKPDASEKGGDFALWINGIRELIKLAREYQVPLEQAMRLAYQRWNQSPFTVSHPGALKKIMTSVLAQQTKPHSTPNSNEDEFSLAEHLKTYQPRKADQ